MPDYKRMMKNKRRPKKNNQQPTKPKRSLGKPLLVLALCALIFALILGMRAWLINLADFEIKQVSVINQEGRTLANTESFFRLDSVDDLNLFNFDMQKITQDIQARHPELVAVSVRKRFPDKLLIVIKERLPVAIIALRNFSLVDAQGFILPYQTGYKDLPEIFGVHPRQIQLYTQSSSLRLKKALELLDELKNAGIHPQYEISKIDVREYSDLVFYLKNGVEVKMGEGELKRKAALLSKILVQLKQEQAAPKYIDMRFGNPVVKPQD